MNAAGRLAFVCASCHGDWLDVACDGCLKIGDNKMFNVEPNQTTQTPNSPHSTRISLAFAWASDGKKTSATVPEDLSLRLPLPHTWTGISLSLSNHLLNRQLNSIRARPFKLTNLRFNLIKIHFQTMISRASSLWRSFFDYKKKSFEKNVSTCFWGDLFGCGFQFDNIVGFLEWISISPHARRFFLVASRSCAWANWNERIELKVNKQIKRENQQFDISKPSGSSRTGLRFLGFFFSSHHNVKKKPHQPEPKRATIVHADSIAIAVTA